MAVPGNNRPRSCSTAPDLLVPVRPLRLDQVVQHEAGAHQFTDPVAERAMVLDVGGHAGRVGLHVRRAVEVGVDGHQTTLTRVVQEDPAHRVGHREHPPPARAHAVCLRITAAVTDERYAPARYTRGQRRLGTAAPARRLHQRHSYARADGPATALRNMPADGSGPTAAAPRAASQRAAEAAPPAVSSTAGADVPSNRASASRRPSGADELRVAQKIAVFQLVTVGVPVHQPGWRRFSRDAPAGAPPVTGMRYRLIPPTMRAHETTGVGRLAPCGNAHGKLVDALADSRTSVGSRFAVATLQ
jgi:hypothetical protein